MHERIAVAFERIKRFGQSELDHIRRGAYGGDADWGDSGPILNSGSETPKAGTKTLLERIKLFNPRQKTTDFLNSTSGRLTMEAGGTAIVIAGAFKFQEITGIPLPMIFFYPFR